MALADEEIGKVKEGTIKESTINSVLDVLTNYLPHEVRIIPLCGSSRLHLLPVCWVYICIYTHHPLIQYIISCLFQLSLQMAAVVGDFLVHPVIDTYADDESQHLGGTINEVYIWCYIA